MFKNSNLNKKQKVLIILIALFIIIGSIIIAIFAYNNRSHFTIKNFNSYLKDVPGNSKKGLENVAWNLVSETVNSVDKEKTYIQDALIRENSYKETLYKGVNTATFLLDIDSIKRTYSVTFSWSKTEEVVDGIIINCPKKTDSKYPDEECQGMYNDFSSIDLYIPFKSSLNSGKTFEVREGYNFENDGKIQINIYVDACGFDSPMEEAEEKTKSYLKSLGIDLNNYKIEATDTCTSYRSKEE